LIREWTATIQSKRERERKISRPLQRQLVAAMAGASGSPEILGFTVSDHQSTHD
jgi:hypothetical protein